MQIRKALIYFRIDRDTTLIFNVPMKNLIFLAFFLLVGCISAGTNFNSDDVSKITPCKSTKAELRNSFGSPYNTGIMSGFSMDRWSYATLSKGESFVAYYDASGLVVDFTLNADPSYSPKNQCKKN